MKRWTPQLKAKLVEGVRSGKWSLDDLLKRHGISAEEYSGWEYLYDRHGLGGLAVTKFKHRDEI